MSVRDDHNAFSLALCRAAGISAEEANATIEVVYRHKVGDAPTITLTRWVLGGDSRSLETLTFKAEQP